MKKVILVIFGGVSTEHEISRVSASYIINNLDEKKYTVKKLGITKSGEWFLYDGKTENIADGSWVSDKANLTPAVISPSGEHHGLILNPGNGTPAKSGIIYIDAAFPALHGKNGEDGTVQGLLTLSGIPFVGCGTFSSAACMDKVMAKIICERAGVKTLPFVYALNVSGFDITAFSIRAEESFDYPMFVKPAGAGSSVGVSKVKHRGEFKDAVLKAFEFDKKVICEKASLGREIEVAVLGGEEILVSGCGEIIPNAEFYDYDAKYINGTAKTVVPAQIPAAAGRAARETAEKVYRALDCRGLARVDFFVDGDDVVFNEINTIPGFTPISMYPKLMFEEGFTAKELVSALVDSATEGRL